MVKLVSERLEVYSLWSGNHSLVMGGVIIV